MNYFYYHKVLIDIGLLDFGRIESEHSSVGKILDVFDYAATADRLGFSRFWVGEHHDYSSSAPWSSPLMLLPLLLNNTERISIGAAGILLNYYSSYQMAMHFKLLANLFPGRVDFGIADGTPAKNIIDLLRDMESDGIGNTVPRKLQEIAKFYNEEDYMAENEKIVLPPFKGATPDVYMLTSNFRHLNTALENKFFLCKSIFHSENSYSPDKDAVLRYSERYEELHGIKPRISITFSGICDPSEEEAIRISKLAPKDHNTLIGTPSLFEDKMLGMQETFGIDEFIFYNSSPFNSQRIESLENLSLTFKLNQQNEI